MIEHDQNETYPSDHAADPSATPVSIPEVDELEDRLRKVDVAMELLQAGELDAAEAAIEELEGRVDSSD